MTKFKTLIIVIAVLIFGAVANASASHSATPETEAISSGPDGFGAALRKTIEESIQTELPSHISDWKIISLDAHLNEKTTMDFDQYRLIPGQPSKSGEIRVYTVELMKNGKIIRKLNVNCRLEMYADTIIAKQAIMRGTVVAEEMVGTGRVKIEHDSSDYGLKSSDVIGRVTERDIPEGKAVRKSLLGKAMDLKLGDLVTIVAQSGTVQLSARGVAKKEGIIGEVIPVVNLRSNKKLSARIVDSQTVEVAF
jgi:flagella basal body P-ring formation protein FlgA